MAHESQFLGSIRHCIKVQFAKIVSGIVLQSIGDNGIVCDTGSKARGQLRESTTRVSLEQTKVRVTVQDASQDESGYRLR